MATETNSLVLYLSPPEEFTRDIGDIINQSKKQLSLQDYDEPKGEEKGSKKLRIKDGLVSVVRTIESIGLEIEIGLETIKNVLFRFGGARSIFTPDDKTIEDRVAGVYFDPKTLPRAKSWRNQLLPIKNQGAKQGSCVAQTAACMKEWQFQRDMGIDSLVPFSPQFVYDHRADHTIPAMSAKEMLQILARHGDCFERTYPYGSGKKPAQIPSHVKSEAAKYKIASFAPVMTVEGAQRSLVENGPLSILVPCYNFGMRMWKKSGRDSEDGAFGGIGHAFTIVGYNERGFELRNSWGPDWGSDGGHCIFPYEDWDLRWEVWTTIS